MMSGESKFYPGFWKRLSKFAGCPNCSLTIHLQLHIRTMADKNRALVHI